MDDPVLERALALLMAKGSEGDGELHLNCEETHALAEHVRRLSKPQPVTVKMLVDIDEVTKAVAQRLTRSIRLSAGTRNGNF